MAPLVDVALVLLIVFMVLTPLADKEMELRVPHAAQARPVRPDEVPPDETVLTVRANGTVVLGGREVGPGDLPDRLRATCGAGASKVLLFEAEDAVRYEDAVRVLDAARDAGVTTIGIMTDPPAAAPRSRAP